MRVDAVHVEHCLVSCVCSAFLNICISLMFFKLLEDGIWNGRYDINGSQNSFLDSFWPLYLNFHICY